jgi:hypothetical protein
MGLGTQQTFLPLTQGYPEYRYDPSGPSVTCVTLDDGCLHKMACAFQKMQQPVVAFAVQTSEPNATAPESPVLTGSFALNGTSCDGRLKFPFAPQILAITLTPYDNSSWFQIQYPFKSRPCSSASDCLAASTWVSGQTGWAGLVPPCSKMTRAKCSVVDA